MIFAFMAYKMSFTEKAATLVEKALDFRLLDLHLDRISDIALNPLEPGHDRPLLPTDADHGGSSNCAMCAFGTRKPSASCLRMSA